MTSSIALKARYSVCALLGSATLALAGAAVAQSDYASGITIYGAPSPYDEHPTLSQHISYGDLDLNTNAGVQVLQRRVARAASALCAELGEPPAIEQNTAVLPSCQTAARESASLQVAQAISTARDYSYPQPSYSYP